MEMLENNKFKDFLGILFNFGQIQELSRPWKWTIFGGIFKDVGILIYHTNVKGLLYHDKGLSKKTWHDTNGFSMKYFCITKIDCQSNIFKGHQLIVKKYFITPIDCPSNVLQDTNSLSKQYCIRDRWIVKEVIFITPIKANLKHTNWLWKLIFTPIYCQSNVFISYQLIAKAVVKRLAIFLSQPWIVKAIFYHTIWLHKAYFYIRPRNCQSKFYITPIDWQSNI